MRGTPNMNAPRPTTASTVQSETTPATPRQGKRKAAGLLLCAPALAIVAGGYIVLYGGKSISTDNAYVRGDVTSLAAEIAGYVTSVEVRDNQSVQSGDVLFRIDDQDYRARLAQAEANFKSAQARLSDVDAQTQLQHAQIRQVESERRSAAAQMNLAGKTHDRNRKLVASNAVSMALVDETAAARAATSLLGRTVSEQSLVIAFDSAFMAVTLLFAVAAPLLVAIKIGFAKQAGSKH